jgi:hypothetical protein
MTKLTRLINLTVANHASRSAAQIGLFFDNMDEVCAALIADGHKIQQRNNEMVLVNHSVWMTKHGVTYPVNSSNL